MESFNVTSFGGRDAESTRTCPAHKPVLPSCSFFLPVFVFSFCFSFALEVSLHIIDSCCLDCINVQRPCRSVAISAELLCRYAARLGAALSSLSEASNFIWAGRGRAVRGVLDRSLRRLGPSFAALLLIDFSLSPLQGPTNPTTLEKRLVYNLKFGLNTHVLFLSTTTHKDGMLPVL